MESLRPSPAQALRLATIASFPPALYLLGTTSTLSHTLTSILDHRPQTTTPAFTALIQRTLPLLSGLTLLSTSASAYLAYLLPSQRRQWATAATAMFLTIPWGFSVMMKGVRRLGDIAADEKTVRKSEMNLEHRQIFVRLNKQITVVWALQVVSAVTGLMAVFKA